MEWIHTVLRMKHLLRDASNNKDVKMSETPQPYEFREDFVSDFVPSWLFNLLAVITNSIEKNNCTSQRKSDIMLDNPTIVLPGSAAFVEVSNQNKFKIMSLAQDLIYLRSKGRRFTPKHVGLAFWLWHKFKSSMLIDFIHALGHCIS